jgi:hypothetical protein
MVTPAFLPQHVWEVSATVIAVLFVVHALIYLTKGNSAPEAEGMSERTVRVVACVMLLFGVGIGLAAFLVDAEPPSAHGSEGWGGAAGVILLVVWLTLVVALEVFKFRKRA